jgi:hypothetical protein
METADDILAREARQHDEAVRKARVQAARDCPSWTEIAPAARLCPRGPSKFNWVVDSDSNRIFRPYPAAVFHSKSANLVADRTELTFIVKDGEVIAYEPVRNPATWSDVIRAHPELAA